MERTQAAIGMVVKASVELHPIGADVFLSDQFAEQSGPTLVMHSIAWQYFPSQVKAACRVAIEKAALRATHEAPLAWLAMETDGTKGSAGLRLKTWPEQAGEGASRLLARVDYHGRWIKWLDSQVHQTIDPGGDLGLKL